MKRPSLPRLTAALFRRRVREAGRVAKARAPAAPPVIPLPAWMGVFRTEEDWRAWCVQDELDEAQEMTWSEIEWP